MRGAALCTAFLLAVAGCGDGTGPPNVVGEYELTEVNGVRTSTLSDPPTFVTGGYLTLQADRTATGRVCGGRIICTVVHLRIDGTWELVFRSQLKITSGSQTLLASPTDDGWMLHWGEDDVRFVRR